MKGQILISLRWKNLLMTALALILSYFFLLLPIEFKRGFHLSLSILDFGLLTYSVISIMAGGYVINDILDIDTDQINEKSSNLVHQIGLRKSYILYGILTGSGLLAGIWLAFESTIITLFNVQLGAVLLLWAYSYLLKMYPLIGNLLIAFICASIPLLVLIYEKRSFHLEWANDYLIFYFLALLAFLVTLVREVVKDAEDVEGDESVGMQTLPILFGTETSKWMAGVFNLFSILLLTLMSYYYMSLNLLLSIIIAVFLMVPLLWIQFSLIKAQNKQQFHAISNWLKSVLLMGALLPIAYKLCLL